jgi:hypothetical protein
LFSTHEIVIAAMEGVFVFGGITRGVGGAASAAGHG